MSREILLVDDSADDARLFLIASKEVGLSRRIRVARSGEAALDLLLHRRMEPALILLDIKMPGIDGLEVLRRLRADAACRDVAVIVLTGSDLESDRAAAVALGCKLFITKPISLEGSIAVAERVKALLSVRPNGSS